MKHRHKYTDTSWVETPMDGYFALLIAVIDLARLDAKLEPGKYKNRNNRGDAQRAKDSADWFLGHLEYQCKSIPSEAKNYGRRYSAKFYYGEITRPMSVWPTTGHFEWPVQVNARKSRQRHTA